MELPFDRDALALRNRLDEADAVAEAGLHTPEQGLRLGLELSALARRLALQNGPTVAPNQADWAADLAHKARRLALPLQRLAQNGR